jgi:hypothetical protein
LEIVDSGGVARLRLGAPLPDATLDGKILPRRSPASGIQLNNAKGDEVGGMAMLDDGLCFFALTGMALKPVVCTSCRLANMVYGLETLRAGIETE